jgi:hypothetical protein
MVLYLGLVRVEPEVVFDVFGALPITVSDVVVFGIDPMIPQEDVLFVEMADVGVLLDELVLHVMEDIALFAL